MNKFITMLFVSSVAVVIAGCSADAEDPANTTQALGGDHDHGGSGGGGSGGGGSGGGGSTGGGGGSTGGGDHGGSGGGGGDHGGDHGDTVSVTCASAANATTLCEVHPFGHIISARVLDESGSAQCTLWDTYGWDGSSLWVKNGCGAEFIVDVR